MLVLSRKVGERIVIEPGIEVVVLKVQANQVKIGVVAPREQSVMRAELLGLRPNDELPGHAQPGYMPGGDARQGGVRGSGAAGAASYRRYRRDIHQATTSDIAP